MPPIPGAAPELAPSHAAIPTPPPLAASHDVTPPAFEDIQSDPPPFDIETHFNDWAAARIPLDKVSATKESMGNAVYEMARPFLGQGYVTMAAINRGLAGFSAHMDSIAQFAEKHVGGTREGLFEKAADSYENNAEYWQERADKVGINFIDELVGEAVGQALPGTASFALDVASGFTFPFMAGAANAEKRGANPVAAGILEAAKTGTLHGLFRMIAPLQQYLRAPATGTIFGLQEMEGAPEGGKGKAFAKGFATGAGYSLTSPGGQLGLNEIAQGVKTQLPLLYNERGSVEIPGKKEKPERKPYPGFAPAADVTKIAPPTTKQRAFLKTVEESGLTAPELAERTKAIDPQQYQVFTNKEAKLVATERIRRDGLDMARDYVLNDKTAIDAEKVVTGFLLQQEYQRLGDFDRAVELTTSLDQQMRRSGQAVQAASLWVELTPHAFIRWGNKQLDAVRKRYGILDTLTGRTPESFELTPEESKQIINLHRKANALPDGPEKSDLSLQMVDIIAKKVPPSVSEMIDAYRYQNMLSSPRTQIRNFTENNYNTFVSRPADIVSMGAIDFIKSGLTGASRESYVKDVALYYKASINAVPNAARMFMEAWRNGPSSTLGKPEIGVEAKDSFELARAKQLPSALTPVSRFMEATDKFTLAIISAGEIARATQSGATPEQAYQAANEVAQSYTYRNKLDPGDIRLTYPGRGLAFLGNLLLKARKESPPGVKQAIQWYVPFVTTPINKAIKLLEYGPTTLLRDPRGLADKETAARVLTGSVLSSVAAGLAFSNETTWTAPTNPDERNLWYATGRKQFSAKIGDSYIPVWYFGPHALSMAFPMAVKHYYSERPEAMTDKASEKLGALIGGIAQFEASQSSTQSIGTLFELMNGNTDRRLMDQTSFTVQQLIPAGAFIRWVNTLVDPTYRKPEGFLEGIEANIPGLSQGITPRLGPNGEPSQRQPLNSFLPYDIGKEDPQYQGELSQADFIKRQAYLGRQMDKVTDKLVAGKITDLQSIEEYSRLVALAAGNVPGVGEEQATAPVTQGSLQQELKQAMRKK